MRVARLETRMTWSEDPLSRSRHLIGNLEVAPLENGELRAKTASLAYHSHLETGAYGNRSRRPVQVQGFGWRPVMSYPRALGPASESPQEGTRGGRMGGCSVWRFDRPAVWIGDPLAGIVGIGSTIAVPGWSSRRRWTERFWPDRMCKRWLPGRRGDSGAMPEARFPGGQQLWRGGDGRHGIAVSAPACGEGGARGAPAGPKLSTMIMRPPQQGQGGR
jgi:Ring hydroxylating beta subunit